MRAWERQEKESARAYEAFVAYRDYGPSRSLAKVGRLLGKSVGLMERWSRQHEWVSRVEALEARDEMIAREAVEDHLASKAEDHATRRVALMEKLLENAEKAAEQASKMLEWPLSEQTVYSEDGREVYVFKPAGWMKNSAVQLQQMAAAAVSGAWASATPDEDEAELDVSELSDEELRTYLDVHDKMQIRRRPRSR